MLLVLAIFWALVGCFISVVYTFLAGGTLEHFFFTAFLAPPIAFFLFIIWGVRELRPPRHAGKQVLGLYFPLAITVFFCLPIILNGSSLAAGLLGYETTAKYLFSFRYLSLPATLLLFVLALCGSAAIVALSTKIRCVVTENKRPPSSASPHAIMQELEGFVHEEDQTPG